MGKDCCSFVHLHNHSDYSLLDGALKIPDMVKAASKENMPALALTDHGNLFGAINFYQKCRAANIKPIIGSEVYLTLGSRHDRKSVRAGGERNYHLVLLAKNEIGYRNLLKLSSAAFLEGFYYKPRIDLELLAERSEGLIALTACLQGCVNRPLLSGDEDTARERLGMLSEIFSDGHLFAELQNHDLEEDKIVCGELPRLAKQLNVPLVATNDCHYLTPGHAESHDLLLCIGTGKDRDDPNRLRYQTNRNHFATATEMEALFGHMPDALKNTLRVAEMVDLDIDLSRTLLPDVPVPEGFTNLDGYLAHLCWQAVPSRYDVTTGEIEERIRYELDVINKVGYAGYFLIVKDFIDAARDRGVPVGPGRGSAAGSIVAYLLRITDVDPIRFNLLFERFLNPERVSFPDVDIDFCYERRGEIIDYVVQKYGERNVSQIITFGTMAARAAIRDVGRVLKVPYGDVDRIAKLVPAEVGMTLRKAEKQVPELVELQEEDAKLRELIVHARNLEGNNRHASTHAAAVLIAPGDLTDYVPLYKSSAGDVTTQWDMKACEKVGLLKMDFLGLRTLTVIHDAVAMIEEYRGVKLDLATLPLDDKETFEFLSQGRTVGVFQFESSGMRDLLVRLRPTHFEDLIAVNALFRPGPLGSGMVDDFIARKHGLKPIEYDDPVLEPVLKDTYGVILYQEQVMRIANEMGGYTLGQADILRRAMGKKNAEEMAENKDLFVKGAQERKFSKAVAKKVFDLMAFFAGYGFNKSHSTAYGLLSYQTAYLKTHYDREFMAATMTSEIGDIDRIVKLIADCKSQKIDVLPPDINKSAVDFRCEGESIRFGLAAIRNVGKSAIQSMILTREEHGEFTSLYQFCENVDIRLINKRVLEALVQAGAFDSLVPSRAALMAAIESALERANRMQSDRARGQSNLFDTGGDGTSIPEPPLPRVDEWDARETLEREKAVLGFYVSGHPLNEFEDELRFANATTTTMAEMKDGQTVALAGIVAAKRVISDRKGNPMAFVTVEDFGGSTEMLVFASVYREVSAYLESDEPLFFRGKISARDEEQPKIMVNDILFLSECQARFTKLIRIAAPIERLTDDSLGKLKSVLEQNPGSTPVQFVICTDDEGEVEIRSRRFRVEPRSSLVEALREAIGADCVSLVGGADE